MKNELFKIQGRKPNFMQRRGQAQVKSKNQATIEVRSSTLSYFSFSSGGFDLEGTMFQTSWVPAWISKSQTLKLVLANSLLARVQDPPSSSRGGVRDLREMRNYVGKVIKWAEKQSRMIRVQKLPTYTWQISIK